MDSRATADALVRALRRLTFEGSLFGQNVAARLGLSASDVEALERLLDQGASTAGALAERMGLTTGAVSRVLDRLEQAGYVRRTPDPADRRRVVIELVPDRIARIQTLLDRLGTASAELLEGYTDEELAVIDDFLTRMAAVARSEAERLREVPPVEEAPTVHSAPLGGLTAARFMLRAGASELRLRGGARAAELYAARFDGPTPHVRVRDGRVIVQYRGLAFDWRKRVATLALNESVPWTIELLGGIGRVEANLTSLDVRGFTLTGGTERVQLELGSPRGTVDVRLTGGAKSIRIERPRSVPTRLTVQGGTSRLELDGRILGPQGGARIEETSGWSGVSDRFDITITGGSKSIELVGRP